MFKYSGKILSLAILLSALLILPVFAQTSASADSSESTTTILSTTTITATITTSDNLEGITTEEVTTMPTGLSLWWRGVKERVNILVTVDPVKKAEKQLQYAEQRMKIADYIIANTTNEKKRAMAEKMIEKANDYTEKIEQKKEKWLNNSEAAKRKLVENIATFQVRKENYLDKIEQKVSPEKLEKFQDLREKSAANGKRIMNALVNSSTPQAVKEKLEAVKEKVENKYEAIKEFQEKKKELIQATKTGEVAPTATLKKLQEQRKEEIKSIIDKSKINDVKKEIKPTSTLNREVNQNVKPAPKPVQAIKQKIEVKKEAISDLKDKLAEKKAGINNNNNSTSSSD